MGIYEMIGVRLSPHRGVIEQLEELERWERQERVRRAAAVARDHQLNHQGVERGAFLEIIEQARSGQECTNKRYNIDHGNKVLQTEEVKKLTFERDDDFGYLKGHVFGGAERRRNELILDELIKAESKPEATPKVDYWYKDIGLLHGFSHKAGCSIYGSLEDKKWIPKVIPGDKCGALTDCKSCSAQESCTWKSGKCVKKSILASSNDPTKCPES